MWGHQMFNFFFLSTISFIHSLNVQNKTKSFQNLWQPTYESCQLRLFILKIKLKQKILDYSLDEEHTKREIYHILAQSHPCLYLRMRFIIVVIKNSSHSIPSCKNNLPKQFDNQMCKVRSLISLLNMAPL